MLKILNAQQTKKADAYTIEHEPIKSIDLMERAARACADWLMNTADLENKQIVVLCGMGNNGGDGLAIARMLKDNDVTVFEPSITENLSAECEINLKKIQKTNIRIERMEDLSDKHLNENTIVIDAMFGSGLNKVLEGEYKKAVQIINKSDSIIVSIDIPSGLYADVYTKPSNPVVRADYTLTFQSPKLSFFFPENEYYVGNWHVLPIGLHDKFMEKETVSNYYIEKEDVISLLKPRARFSHKGTYGHALVIAGSKGKMGAAVLMAKACMRSGAGLVTAHIPDSGNTILQSAVPEVMLSLDTKKDYCARLPKLESYNALAMGCGIGNAEETCNMLKLLIQEAKVPLVLDADALNILAENKTWLSVLASGTILTPHPKEFERLAGKWGDGFERLELLKKFCQKHKVYVVLKDAYSVTCTPSGNCYFNSTGNAGMATGGSGDVLTGIITGLLAQGYEPAEACIIGVYLHGLAGDIAVAKKSMQSLIASDIIEYLGYAFKL